MKVTFTAQPHVDIKCPMSKILGYDIGLFMAKEMYRVYKDEAPHNTGTLRDKVKIRPREVLHYSPYAAYIYKGEKMVDPEYGKGGFTADGIKFWSRKGVRKKLSGEEQHLKNGSKEWDKAAWRKGKMKILTDSIQNWIDNNI